MICPNCNYDNKNTNIKCEKCKKQLISENEINTKYYEINILDNKGIISDTKEEKSKLFYEGIFVFIVGLLFTGGCLFIFAKTAGIFEKIVIIPFLICSIAVLINGIGILLKTTNIIKTLNHSKNKKISKYIKN